MRAYSKLHSQDWISPWSKAHHTKKLLTYKKVQSRRTQRKFLKRELLKDVS